MVQLSINLPQYPEGEEIAIAGLGRFPNGGDAVEIDEDTVAAFEEAQGMSIEDALRNNPGVTVDGKEGTTFEPPNEEEDTSAPSTPEAPQTPQSPTPQEGSEA
jgi:hypothetical protein